jgi:hypothetical protein
MSTVYAHHVIVTFLNKQLSACILYRKRNWLCKLSMMPEGYIMRVMEPRMSRNDEAIPLKKTFKMQSLPFFTLGGNSL